MGHSARYGTRSDISTKTGLIQSKYDNAEAFANHATEDDIAAFLNETDKGRHLLLYVNSDTLGGLVIIQDMMRLYRHCWHAWDNFGQFVENYLETSEEHTIPFVARYPDTSRLIREAQEVFVSEWYDAMWQQRASMLRKMRTGE